MPLDWLDWGNQNMTKDNVAHVVTQILSKTIQPFVRNIYALDHESLSTLPPLEFIVYASALLEYLDRIFYAGAGIDSSGTSSMFLSLTYSHF